MKCDKLYMNSEKNNYKSICPVDRVLPCPWKSNKVCVLWYYWFYTETQVLLIIFWRRKCFRTNVPILITRHIIPVRKKEELLNIIDPVSYMRLKFIDTQFPCCHTGCQAAIVSWYCKNSSSINSTIFCKKICRTK